MVLCLVSLGIVLLQGCRVPTSILGCPVHQGTATRLPRALQ